MHPSGGVRAGYLIIVSGKVVCLRSTRFNSSWKDLKGVRSPGGTEIKWKFSPSAPSVSLVIIFSYVFKLLSRCIHFSRQLSLTVLGQIAHLWLLASLLLPSTRLQDSHPSCFFPGRSCRDLKNKAAGRTGGIAGHLQLKIKEKDKEDGKSKEME